MNKQTFLSFLLLLFLQVSIMAQNCDYMRKYKKGTIFQFSSFDKKGKLTSGDESSVVIDKIPTTSGWELQIGTQGKDKEGKPFQRVLLRTKCENGVYVMDMKENVQLPIDSTNMTSTTLTGDAFKYVDVAVGNSQPDAYLEYATKIYGANFMKVKMKSFNRKVVAIENVTTSAGTFECFKITFDWEVKVLATQKGTTIEYWSKDYGIVKTTRYNSKGKEEGRYELTKFQE